MSPEVVPWSIPLDFGISVAVGIDQYFANALDFGEVLAKSLDIASAIGIIRTRTPF